MSREVICYKNFFLSKIIKLLRCETKVYTPRKRYEERLRLIFTLVSGFEAHSTALRGALTC